MSNKNRVFWKCTEDCFMWGNNHRVFSKGVTYEQAAMENRYLGLIDDEGDLLDAGVGFYTGGELPAFENQDSIWDSL